MIPRNSPLSLLAAALITAYCRLRGLSLRFKAAEHAALALMGESDKAPAWAALARAHHHRTNQLLSPDGYYYEGIEYWIFSAPWLVHFLDAWEHATGENLWDRGQYRNWKYAIAHSILPDGQTVFDFGDIWQGPLTRAKRARSTVFTFCNSSRSVCLSDRAYLARMS